MKRLIGLSAVLVLMGVAAIACGDDGAGTASTAAPPSADSTLATPDAPTTSAATVTETEDVVLADGRLVIPGQNVGDVDLTHLPVGDDSLVDRPTVGGLHLCETFPTDGMGALVAGPWFNDDGTYDLTAKSFVLGEVEWPDAAFEVTVEGDQRVLTGNDLPVAHSTGEFPIADDDPAAQYDQNPSGITENPYEVALPANPTEAAEPGCVGGEVGILLSGVVLNSPVDAMGRDAVAWESQDHCEGHPNDAGYHYHSVSPCIPDEGTGHSDVVGFALDGYPIAGHRGEDGRALTNDDLDECHGHTHEVELDGELVETYHYHATWEFPYVVGCFHGTSSVQGPLNPPG
jgi:hypothetical protein